MDNASKIKIEHEISRIEKSLNDVKPLLDLCKIKEPDKIELIAAAQVLHSFYNGIENIILLIFKGIGENIPNDLQWHKKLFEKTFETTEKRPMLFRDEYKEKLIEYLSFRHFFRHSYGFEIDWNRLKPLITGVEDLWKILKEDINKFLVEEQHGKIGNVENIKIN